MISCDSYYSVISITKLLSVLGNAGKIEADTISRVEKFIADNNTYKGDSNGDVEATEEKTPKVRGLVYLLISCIMV